MSSVFHSPGSKSIHRCFACNNVWLTARDFTPPGPWSVVDEWLAHSAMVRTIARGCLEVMLAQSVYLSGHAGFFPEFRKAGGEVRRESRDYHMWDLATTFALSQVKYRAGRRKGLSRLRRIRPVDWCTNVPIGHRWHPFPRLLR